MQGKIVIKGLDTCYSNQAQQHITVLEMAAD